MFCGHIVKQVLILKRKDKIEPKLVFFIKELVLLNNLIVFQIYTFDLQSVKMPTWSVKRKLLNGMLLIIFKYLIKRIWLSQSWNKKDRNGKCSFEP